MGTKRTYSITVISDEEGEVFSPSSCTCMECVSIHTAQMEWDTFTPETQLQKRMKMTIANIETKAGKSGEKSNIKKIPKRLKSTKEKRNRKS